jgi:hypothetical protein
VQLMLEQDLPELSELWSMIHFTTPEIRSITSQKIAYLKLNRSFGFCGPKSAFEVVSYSMLWRDKSFLQTIAGITFVHGNHSEKGFIF